MRALLQPTHRGDRHDRTGRNGGFFHGISSRAASVILTGALYALLFAWSRMKHTPRLMPLAYLPPTSACSFR
jgi:hypothetical protein